VSDEPAASILEIEPVEGGLSVRGQVDLSNVDAFLKAVTDKAAGAAELVLDLGECTYMGSEGIGVLIEALRSLEGGRLVLRSPSGIIMKVLDLAGLSKLPSVEISR
jgi:anti-anti-sigma factor